MSLSRWRPTTKSTRLLVVAPPDGQSVGGLGGGGGGRDGTKGRSPAWLKSTEIGGEALQDRERERERVETKLTGLSQILGDPMDGGSGRPAHHDRSVVCKEGTIENPWSMGSVVAAAMTQLQSIIQTPCYFPTCVGMLVSVVTHMDTGTDI